MTEARPPISSGSEGVSTPEPNYVSKFRKLMEKACAAMPVRAAIFAHACPDPDAIGAMMAIHWLLLKAYQIESDLFFVGGVSHPQNIAMVNLLDPNLRTVEEYKAERYGLHVLVDAVPANAGVGENKISFDLVIDHHKESPPIDFEGLFINLKAGSSCATVYDLIEKLGFSFEDNNEIDGRVATALLVGINTDTENLMADDATEVEFQAWARLFPLRNALILRQIINFSRPKFWIESKAEAIMRATIEDGVAVVGMGMIPAKDRDMIADMSQEMATWEDVHTAVAFALVDGTRLEGSVRSSNPSVSVPKLCKELAGRHGCGGGKLGKGAYRIELGGGSVDDEDTEDTRKKLWEVYAEKEKNRILKKLKK